VTDLCCCCFCVPNVMNASDSLKEERFTLNEIWKKERAISVYTSGLNSFCVVMLLYT
jgi:hypothetical protein